MSKYIKLKILKRTRSGCEKFAGCKYLKNVNPDLLSNALQSSGLVTSTPPLLKILLCRPHTS